MYNMPLLEAGNEQDVNTGESCVIITDKESGLMLVIEDVFSQIAEIKSSLEFSRLKEKYNTKSNHILKNITNNISHLALKKIWVEIKRVPEIIDDPINKCGHYLRKSHGLLCSCELITRFEHILPVQLEDISAFWRTTKNWGMRDLASLLDQISIGPILKVREILSYCERGIMSGFGSGSGSSSGSCGRGRPPRAPRGKCRGRGRSSE
ncbi:hypothetical protein M9H77_18849 [Catharanthus roseus]|uniref:Uncharacterized protein n=1 Tax=Catharanthus roseus TaxID=4058 RepID=A0ACC0B8L4_CATRO|nr:hypothetical protein M9H77_18849 [Catharanthus roseus]